jgi:hypothetical protein
LATTLSPGRKSIMALAPFRDIAVPPPPFEVIAVDRGGDKNANRSGGSRVDGRQFAARRLAQMTPRGGDDAWDVSESDAPTRQTTAAILATCHSLVCRGYAGSDRVVSATSNLASIMRARYLGSFTIPTRSAAHPLVTDASLDAIPRSNNRSCPIVILTPGCPFPTAGKLLFVKVQQNRTSGIAHRETRTAGRCRCWSMCRHRGRPSRTVPGVDI